MSKRVVKFFEWDGQIGLDVERPLDDAPANVIRLASLVHGRELSDAEYEKLLRTLDK